MLLENAESWVSSSHSAKLLRKLLPALWLLPWTWLHIAPAGLLVPLANGMGSDSSFRACWVLLAAWGPLGAGAASCSASSELSEQPLACPALPAAHPCLPATLVLPSSRWCAVSRDVLAVCHSLFRGSRLFPLLLAELFLIILFGLPCTIINS